MILEAVAAVLESIAAPYALIGGQAVALRGYPRLTIDYDFLRAPTNVLMDELSIAKAQRQRSESVEVLLVLPVSRVNGARFNLLPPLCAS